MTLTKDDFPTGTRVRVVKFEYDETNPQSGATGTVLADDDDDFEYDYVSVRRDGRSADDEFPFRPSELEIIAPVIAVGTRVRLDDSGHWSSLAAGKTATVAKVTPSGEITLDIDDADFHQWTRVDDTHFTVLGPEPSAEPTFALGDVVRVKDNITLDNGKHNGQVGTVTRIGPYYVWAQVPTSGGSIPFHAEELTHVEPASATPDLAADLRKHAALLTDDLDEVNIVIVEASEKRDNLRQDIAALKNAAARLEAQK